jgi:hypothetical protein
MLAALVESEVSDHAANDRQHHSERISVPPAEKGILRNAIGRSRGGLSTKIHA